MLMAKIALFSNLSASYLQDSSSDEGKDIFK